MEKSTQSPNPEPNHEQISALAQQIYEGEGCPCGKADEHWHEAERQLHQRRAGEGGTIVDGESAQPEHAASV